MAKKMINKRANKKSVFSFLVTILILAIALVFGVKLVQKTQETRSFAYDTYEDGGNSDFITSSVVGVATWFNRTACRNVSGKCADFSRVYSEGTSCRVGSLYGRIRINLCPSYGDNIMCCTPNR